MFGNYSEVDCDLFVGYSAGLFRLCKCMQAYSFQDCNNSFSVSQSSLPRNFIAQ